MIKRFLSKFKTRFIAVRYKQINRNQVYYDKHKQLAKELGTTIKLRA